MDFKSIRGYLPSQVFTSCFFLLSTAPVYADTQTAVENISKIEPVSAVTEAQSSTPLAPENTVLLGTAYDSKREGYFALQSVKGIVDETYGNTKTTVRVGVDLGYKQLLNLVSGNVDASLDIPAIRVDAGASYASEASADEYTGSYTIHVATKPKKRLLLPTDNNGYQPTSGALELARQFPGNKVHHLGDEFVYGMEFGSFLIVNMQIEYRNAQDKRDISGYLGVDWIGQVKVDGSLQLLDDDVKKSVKIKITAWQEGGDPQRLANIIPDGIIRCSLLNPTPCFDLFEEAVVYLKTDYINQFDSLDKYQVSRVFTSPYLNSGSDLQVLVPESGYENIQYLTKLAVKSMTQAWVQSRLDKRRADNILNYYADSITSSHRIELEQLSQDASFNSSLYADAVSYCKNNPYGSLCQVQRDQVEAAVREYDRQYLQLESL